MKFNTTITKLILLATTSINVFGQSRENRQNLSFDKRTENVSKAIGWMLNKETGKWVENKNVIDERVCPSYWVSHISQNFKWIQFATIVHKGRKYYVFLFERLSGEYKYPNIQEDWEKENITCFFILDSIQYDNLKMSVNSKEQKDIQFKSKISGYITDRYKILGGENLYNEENLLSKITNTLDKVNYSEDCFLINSQQIDGKEIVRFRLPESCIITKYSKDAYFEIELTEFSKLLTL